MIVVQASFFRVEKDEVLLERAESAKVAAVVVGRRPLQDAPADIVGDVRRGQFSYIPAEGGAVCRVVLVEAPDIVSMTIPALLKSSSRQSDVFLSLIAVKPGDLRLVYDALHLPHAVCVTLTGQGTLRF